MAIDHTPGFKYSFEERSRKDLPMVVNLSVAAD